jgi:hypothetical protein
MLYHDVHHAFPNAVGTMSMRGRFNDYRKVADACVEVLHRGLFVPTDDAPTKMETMQKRRTEILRPKKPAAEGAREQVKDGPLAGA